MPRRTDTRRAILNAAQKLLRTEGEGAVTTRAVTKMVGISQPAFYGHFDNVEELVVEVASQVASEMLALNLEASDWLRRAGPADQHNLAKHFGAILDRAMADRGVIEVYIRHRWLDSRVGEFCRGVDHAVERALVEHITQSSHIEPDSDRVAAIEQLAHAIVHTVHSGFALMLDGRMERDRVAELLATQTLGAVAVCLGPMALIMGLRGR
ncbi:MAG: TetR/AcrR family transcriptional regulator [Myxococcota bacterium]